MATGDKPEETTPTPVKKPKADKAKPAPSYNQETGAFN